MLFYYQAKTKEGEERKGVVEAINSELALKTLQGRDFLVLSLIPGEKKSFFQNFSFFQRIKSRDIVVLARQFSTLFEAKIPIVRGFEILISETNNINIKKQLNDILLDVQAGLPLSQAFARKSEIFSEFFINMIKVGEESGRLEQSFIFLADHLERNYELVSKTKNALFYPAFLFGAFIIVIGLMFTVVIPKLSGIILETGQDIPFYTKVVIGVSNFARTFGIPFLLAAVSGIIFLRWYYFKSAAGKFLISWFQLSFPVLGKLFQKIYLARLSDDLRILMSGGVSVIRSLEIISRSIGSPIYGQIIKEAIEKVKAGSLISDALLEYKDIPHLFTQMLKIGEETGKVDQILVSLSRFYQREVNNAVDNMVSIIEPLMIVIMGAGIGLLVASILIPIYNMTTAL